MDTFGGTVHVEWDPDAAATPLVGAGVVTRLAKHDTNPANSPQMPEKYRPRS